MSDKDYKIRFAGADIPAHEVWSKLEVANQALAVLENFNKQRAQIATDFTRDTEQEVRKRLGGIEVMLPEAPAKTADLQDTVKALLLTHSPEEVIDILRRDHATDCDMDGLVYLAGWPSYLQALVNDASTLKQNAISPDQMADLWNEAGRPCPGQPFWNRHAVDELLARSGG